MPRNKKHLAPYYYPPAEEKMADIWAYSSQWGENHADRYTKALYRAIEKNQEEGNHKTFPRAKTSDITADQVYFSFWKYKSRTLFSTGFYRVEISV